MIQERADRLSHCDIEDEQQVLLPNMVSDEVGAEQSVAHSRLASFMLPSILLKASSKTEDGWDRKCEKLTPKMFS